MTIRKFHYKILMKRENGDCSSAYLGTYDEIEEEGDRIEEDNPTADNVEELPIRQILLGSGDEDLRKSGPSGIPNEGECIKWINLVICPSHAD